MKNFLVIGATKSLLLQLLLALHAHADARCIVLCAKGTRFMKFSTLCSDCTEADFGGNDDEAFVARANRLAETMPEITLIAADCAGARMIGRVRRRITMRIAATPNPATLDRLDNKWQFYLLCASLGLNVPETLWVGDKTGLDFESVTQKLGVPFVIKPINEDSSRGTYVIAGEPQYNKEIRDNPDYLYGPLIAQSYIAGQDVGINFHADGGHVTAVSIQKRVEPAHDGSCIEFFQNDYLLQAARSIAAVLAYDGVMNIDARIQDATAKVFLFESNPRFWRSLSASTWCGLNFAAECLEPMHAAGDLRILDSGSADTYYHPLFQPSLWRYGLFDRGDRGRIVRLMMRDLPIFLSSAKIVWLRYRAKASHRFKISPPRKKPKVRTHVGVEDGQVAPFG